MSQEEVERAIRLLPFGVASGAENMAADQVLLESALEGVASLRFYGWSEPTLSLGYFQPAGLRLRDESLSRLPFVRRPTGGATLVHDRELTYAVALPTGRPWQAPEDPPAVWLSRAHEIIRDALQAVGIVTAMTRSRHEARDPDFLCFQQPTPGDLLIGAHKVVGSAQRRQRGALLQHGAVLLARSPHALSLPGIKELAGISPSCSDLRATIVREWTKHTGWRLQQADWPAALRQRIAVVAETRYSQAQWNEKR